MHLNDEQVADIGQALHELPTRCRYHDLKFIRITNAWTTHSRRWAGRIIAPCCDTGASAFHRYFGGVALGWTVGAEWPEDL